MPNSPLYLVLSKMFSIISADGAQGRPPPNMPRWHIDYFELKLLEKQLAQERSYPPLFPWKWKTKLSWEGILPVPGG